MKLPFNTGKWGTGRQVVWRGGGDEARRHGMRLQDSSRRLRGGGGAGGGGWRGAAVACGLTKQLDADKPRTQYDKLEC
jgi:hypothetical protein